MIKERYEESIAKRRTTYCNWWDKYIDTLKATGKEKLALEKSNELWETYQTACSEYDAARNTYIEESKTSKKKKI